MQLPITVPSTFRIIAHRGASAYAPENCRPAFDLAREMGVVEIEVDTQLTTDGQIALCHDTSLARYGHGERKVEEMPWNELANLDMGSWFSPHLFGGERMMTLDQLFDMYGDSFTYHVELKGTAPGLPAAVHEALSRTALKSSCIITSFHYDSLVAMRAIDAGLRLGWLVQEIDNEVQHRAEAINLFQLCPRADQVTARMVGEARSSVQEVRAWGLMGESAPKLSADVQALIDNVVRSGCDGMTINWPDWVRHAA